MTADLMNLASGFGAPGLLVSFMVWDRVQQNKLAEKRIAADVAVASSIAVLTRLVERLPHV